ncbi:MAG: nucleotidyltransferase family protein [Aliarcobacter butzleri]|nr:nucleotidyltransferase family protein [Aliarcobacter butzleri]
MKIIEKIKLKQHSTIKEAIEVLGSGAINIAIVVDDDNRLLGTLTDGDLRQAFLKGKNIHDDIDDVYFKNPTVVNVNISKEEVIEICILKKIYQIPVVDNDKKVIDIHIYNELLKPKVYSNKVVLMVGGLGARLRPLTQNMPKSMLNVGNKPILETIILNFKKYGFRDIILSVNYKSHIIKDYFKDGNKFGVNIEYVHETKRMGTAGALSLMKDKLSDPFFVMNGDLLTNVNFSDMMEYHISNKAIATMGVREYDFQVPYGVVNLKDNNIVSIEEKPINTFFVSGGIYVLNPEVLDFLKEDKFYDMPTLFTDIVKKDKKSISFLIRDYWLDIGIIDEYEKANKEYFKIF